MTARYSIFSLVRNALSYHENWPEAWRRTVESPEVADSTLILWAKSWMQHGDYLETHSGTLNWLFTESNGLFTLGILFPEFQDATRWRDLAISRIANLLAADIYPDGAHVELAPHYHILAIEDLTEILELSNMNNETIDTTIVNGVVAYQGGELSGAIAGKRLDFTRPR